MTHNTESLEPSNFGSRDAYLHTINITSLDAAGQENYDPSTEVNVPDGPNRGVVAVGQDDPTVSYAWNHTGNHLSAVDVADATDEANNADLGEVRLLVVGGGT